jgi:phosphoribosylformylglycinamidine synthase
MFRYCDEKGSIADTFNPNGTSRHIAGIRNREGNVFGMMPHPERAVSTELGNTDGKRVLSCWE